MPYKNKEQQKLAQAASFQRNKVEISKRQRRRKEEIRKYVAEALTGKACNVCGEADPVVLEFHHRDPTTKIFNLAAAAMYFAKDEAIDSEIAKCDILCANCHRRESYAETRQRFNRPCYYTGAPRPIPMPDD